MASQRQPSTGHEGMASAIKVFQSLYKDQWIHQARLLGMYTLAGIDICRHRAAIYRVHGTATVLSVLIEFKNNKLCRMAYLEFLSDYQNITNS